MTGGSAPAPRSRWFPVALAAGWAIMAYGVAGAVGDASDTHPAALARWLVGSALAHDLLLAPAVLLVGFAARRRIPTRWRAAVQAALVVTGVVVLFAVPLLGRFGERPDNPTVLYRDYGMPVALVVAGIWIAAGTIALVAGRRGHTATGQPRLPS